MFLVCLADFFGGLLSLSAFSLLPPFVSSPLSNFLLLILVSLEIRFLHLIDLVCHVFAQKIFLILQTHCSCRSPRCCSYLQTCQSQTEVFECLASF